MLIIQVIGAIVVACLLSMLVVAFIHKQAKQAEAFYSKLASLNKQWDDYARSFRNANDGASSTQGAAARALQAMDDIDKKISKLR